MLLFSLGKGNIAFPFRLLNEMLACIHCSFNRCEVNKSITAIYSIISLKHTYSLGSQYELLQLIHMIQKPCVGYLHSFVWTSSPHVNSGMYSVNKVLW